MGALGADCEYLLRRLAAAEALVAAALDYGQACDSHVSGLGVAATQDARDRVEDAYTAWLVSRHRREGGS